MIDICVVSTSTTCLIYFSQPNYVSTLFSVEFSLKRFCKRMMEQKTPTEKHTVNKPHRIVWTSNQWVTFGIIVISFFLPAFSHPLDSMLF